MYQATAVRSVSWLVNAALLCVCCFLVADTANAVFKALLTPKPEVLAEHAAPVPSARDWSDRQVILARNLFNSALLAPPPPPVVVKKKKIEKTKLPLSLLGTAASSDPERAWAVIADRKARETIVVGIDDKIRNQATVTSIARQRIVLSENGELRELVLDNSNGKRTSGPPKKKSRANKRRRRRASR